MKFVDSSLASWGKNGVDFPGVKWNTSMISRSFIAGVDVNLWMSPGGLWYPIPEGDIIFAVGGTVRSSTSCWKGTSSTPPKVVCFRESSICSLSCCSLFILYHNSGYSLKQCLHSFSRMCIGHGFIMMEWWHSMVFTQMKISTLLPEKATMAWLIVRSQTQDTLPQMATPLYWMIFCKKHSWNVCVISYMFEYLNLHMIRYSPICDLVALHCVFMYGSIESYISVL